MPPQKSKRHRTEHTSVEAMSEHGAQLCSSTHAVVMESIWQHLYKNPELACQIHVMISNRSFEKIVAKEEKWLTSNNKMQLAPREIFDKVLSAKHPTAAAYFQGKKAKKDKVMEFVCFVLDMDLNCAVLSKHVDTFIRKLSERWDELAGARLEDFPKPGESVSDQDMSKVGYFALEVKEGKTYIKHQLSGQMASLPEELQDRSWSLESNLNHRKATIKSGDIHEFLVSKVFNLVDGLEMPSPMCLKQVPAEEVCRSPAASPRSCPSPTSVASGSVSSEGGPRQLKFDGEGQIPPPPPGLGGSI